MQNCVAIGAGADAALTPTSRDQISFGGQAYVGSQSTIGTAGIEINPTGTGSLTVGSCTIATSGGQSSFTAPTLTATTINPTPSTSGVTANVQSLQTTRPDRQVQYQSIRMSDYPGGSAQVCNLTNYPVVPGISNVWYCNSPNDTMDTIRIPNPNAANTELVIIFDILALKLIVRLALPGDDINLFVAKYTTGAPTNSLYLNAPTDNLVATTVGTAGIFSIPITATFSTTSFNLISDGSYWIQQ